MPCDIDILNYLRGQSGLKGREIANRLNADKSQINKTLWRLRTQGLVRQDNAYRWFLVDKSTGKPSTKAKESPRQPK